MIRKLSELKPGDEGVIANVIGGGPLVRRIVDMGLAIGAKIKILRKAPLGDPVEFEVKGYNLSLRKSEAEHVFVEIEKQ